MPPDDLHVGVGTDNPVKTAATRAAIQQWRDARVEAIGVPSGVAPQPKSQAETIAGARHRAQAVREQTAVDISVGIESGLATFPEADGSYLFMAAAATDRTRMEIGVGPAIRLPTDVAAAVDRDEPLGEVLQRRFGGDPAHGGTISVLTDGAVTRERALAMTVTMAVAPLCVPVSP